MPSSQHCSSLSRLLRSLPVVLILLESAACVAPHPSPVVRGRRSGGLAGAAIGVAGPITGLVLGLVFCLNIAAIQHFLEWILGVQLFNADVYMLDSIPAEVDAMDVVWVTLWSVFMSCVASLLPSWRAAKMDPVEALRYE